MLSEQELQDVRERAREDMERCRALRAEQERVVRENNMTVVDLLEMLEPEDGNYDRKTVEEVLSLILRRAEYYYDDWEDDICGFAVGLAHLAVRADGMDKGTAKEMTRYMAVLADFMLNAEGAGEWDFETLTALKKIRNTDSEVVAFTETTRVAS